MRLIFSSTNHMNTDISDEQGYKYYTISTPFAFFNKVTTITKYNWNGASGNGVPETMGIIEWHTFKQTQFQFNGRVIRENDMLERQSRSSGRQFTGPDGQKYKWKIKSHCWLRHVDSYLELARFHKKNLGIMKPSHPPFLDVSDRVAQILDYVVLTFVYVEWLRLRRKRREAHVATHVGLAVVNVLAQAH